MSNVPYTADDAALAVSTMTNQAIADLPFVSRKQSDEDFSRIAGENRKLISNLIRLYGLTELGEAIDGDDAAAQKIIDDALEFQRDPLAFTNRVFGDIENQSSSTQAQLSTPENADAGRETAQNPLPTLAQAPTMDFTQAIAVSPIQVPMAKIRWIPRPAQALFPGIGDSYNGEMIPTAAWETPKPDLPDADPHFSFSGYAMTIMALAIDERKNVLATGDPGCGKTEFFKQFGARIGLPVTKIPMDGSLTRAEIIGSFRQVATPTGSATPFIHGLIPRLIQQPGIIILDEIDQSDPDIMYMLHPVLEGQGLTIQEEGGLIIPRHPDCFIVATANTKGRGSDNGLTHSRYEMSEATRDRFPYWLSFTFLSPEKEAATLHSKTNLELPSCVKMVSVANKIRTAYKTGEMSQTCSLRQLIDVAPAARRFSSRGVDVGLALGMETVMVGRANTEDAAVIREFIKTVVAVDLNTTEL